MVKTVAVIHGYDFLWVELSAIERVCLALHCRDESITSCRISRCRCWDENISKTFVGLVGVECYAPAVRVVSHRFYAEIAWIVKVLKHLSLSRIEQEIQRERLSMRLKIRERTSTGARKDVHILEAEASSPEREVVSVVVFGD